MEPKQEETRVERINRLKREALERIDWAETAIGNYPTYSTEPAAAALVAIAKLLYVLTSQDTGRE